MGLSCGLNCSCVRKKGGLNNEHGYSIIFFGIGIIFSDRKRGGAYRLGFSTMSFGLRVHGLGLLANSVLAITVSSFSSSGSVPFLGLFLSSSFWCKIKAKLHRCRDQ